MSENREEHDERRDDAHVASGAQEPAATHPAPPPAPAPYALPPRNGFRVGNVIRSSAVALLGAGLLGGLVGGGVVAAVDAVTSRDHGRPAFSRPMDGQRFQEGPRGRFQQPGGPRQNGTAPQDGTVPQGDTESTVPGVPG